MLVECGFFSNPGEPTANTTDSSACPDLPATMQMPLFRIREQSPRSPLPSTTGEGFFMPARHTSDYKTLFPKRISMSCSFIKTKTASILFQTLAVVLRWWRRRESNPCPEGFRGRFVMRQLGRLASCLWKSRALRGNPALHQPAECSSSPLAGVEVLTRLN